MAAAMPANGQHEPAGEHQPEGEGEAVGGVQRDLLEGGSEAL